MSIKFPLSITTYSGMDLSLRLLTEVDIPAVMQLERSAHSHPWRQSSFEDCLTGRQKCWLAEYKENLVGLVVITHGGGDAELLNISVSPAFQRKGIGRCLLHHALDCVRDKADMLFLEVRVSNHKAIDLYAKEGFFEVGQRKNYYPTLNGHEDALLMAMQL
ncbi:ribosomal protein S18-alanine N-acetyltransferase [Cellvibrio japonicus]|uniref:[Ribosomal protein bS18]-alanine N-acetyltransferase n=1 Tax=Cellvibrio japonicus (strain Ueda107) TaxID=498211 RepID=B3PL82_CELJU|nr:ribosomal protein S18-alanine N-acetyltransferase [Cellvibrio japonicus]ACE83971.1 ribosomal-protein-alanine acetyltransferase [Cellvibrio japonicus Ueda107]QEI11541.1 ribosomal-protein-alanine N-acetyltransferase [Cellvibrio japonicus]QEI15115.1 ribosomal-protein-alanine N-acetyltransferase [Cellvibrio japonicus]QEI18695.1 ribosomal-protein-alanine N-acetyltransferase [Cellvibrio japonicus]